MSQPIDQPDPPALPKARLLIVDDEALQLRALTETLAAQGFDVHGFDNASHALAYLRNARADMLLTDLMMPGVDGIALVRGALKIDPMLAAVVITGVGTIDTAVEAMRSGACDYILKPFRLRAILPVIERGLEMRRLRVENEALERRVRNYVAQLEATNHELDAFTRSASHDLRTPLNAVLGFATLLQKNRSAANLTPVQREWIANIDQSARRMNQLIGDLLRLSQFGRQALVLDTVDLGPLVSGVLGEVRRQYPHPVTLAHGPMPRVRADESLLRQVFVNLLSNAFKFTAHTPGARIEIGFEDQAGERIYFVRDNGAGFDLSEAGALFQPFQRLHGAHEFEGSGVGLSIVQRIVERHGGRVWAQSAPGTGATFRFTLGAPEEAS